MCKHVCLSKYIGKTIFVVFSVFYGILFQSKRPSFKSQFSILASAGRPTCTDVHASSGRRAGRPTRSTVQRELCSLESPGRPSRSTGRELCSLFQATVPVDRGSNGQISDRWRSTGPVDRQQSGLLIGPQRLVFSWPIKWGFLGLF